MFGRKRKKKVSLLRKIYGSLFIILGVLGILLPLLPGWLFIFIGFYLWGHDLYAEHVQNRLRKAFGKKFTRRLNNLIKKLQNKFSSN